MTPPFNLSGSKALITGAGSPTGIGFASAKLLCQMGASVYITGASDRLNDRVSELQEQGFSVAGYGCPARFSTITNFSGLSAADISLVVDDSPLKQGRFSPGMHIPIVSYHPEEKPDVYIVFAFEYIASIKEKVGVMTGGYFKPVPFIEI